MRPRQPSLSFTKAAAHRTQLHRTEQQMTCSPKRTSEAHTSAQTPAPRKRKCLHTEFRQTVRGVSQQAAGPCQNLPRDTGQLLGFLVTSPINGNRTSLTNPHCQHWGSPAWTSSCCLGLLHLNADVSYTDNSTTVYFIQIQEQKS